ncbi:MAG: O-antigen ligase family protein [Bacilli bacterium]|nr:O-antigen ligase family protein [Bacilli bacterium]
MHKYIKENISKLLTIFILLQPVLDLITGVCVNLLNINITLGIIIRILFLGLLMYTTVFIYKKKFSLYTYLALAIYSILYLIGIIIYKDGVVFYELQGLLKAIYFPIVLVSLYDLKDEYQVSKQTLFKTLFIYLVLILIPNALGLGFESYKITKSGSLGFFNAANEISGIISLLTPIMFLIIKDLKNKILKVVYVLIYLIVILTIGTKTPLLTLLITIGFTYLYYMIHCIKKKTYKPLAITGIAIVVALSSLLLILPKTNFYKNIKVHLDYLEVDNVFEIFQEYELVDHFIFSQRLTFLDNKSIDYIESSTYEKIFGIGYTEKGEQTKLIEMDYFDIFFSHGIVGAIIIIGIYLYILYKVLSTDRKIDFENYMVKLSIFLILLLSFFTGHIITAPAVSIIAVILILDNMKVPKLKKKGKKKKIKEVI